MPLTESSDGHDQNGANDGVEKKSNPRALRHAIPGGHKKALADVKALEAELQTDGPPGADEDKRDFNSVFREYLRLCGHEYVSLFL